MPSISTNFCFIHVSLKLIQGILLTIGTIEGGCEIQAHHHQLLQGLLETWLYDLLGRFYCNAEP